MFCFTFQKWYTEWIHSTDIWCTSHQYLRTIPPFCTWDQKVHVAKIFTFYQSGDTYGISWYLVKKFLTFDYIREHRTTALHFVLLQFVLQSQFSTPRRSVGNGLALPMEQPPSRLIKGKDVYVKLVLKIGTQRKYLIVVWPENMSDPIELSPDVKMLQGQLFSHIFTFKKETHFNFHFFPSLI